MIQEIDEVKKSLVGSSLRQPEKGGLKTSSLVTIFASINSMVGSVVLQIPVNWKKSGVLFSTIAMLTIGLLSYKTCSWIVIVTKGQPDLRYIAKTYLGEINYKIFALSSGILLFWIGQVYFLLLNASLFQVLSQIFHWTNYKNFSPPGQSSFSEFSWQWQAIIAMALISPLYFVKKIDFIVKIGRIGAVSLYAYILLIFYLFFDNIPNINSQSVKELDLFTSDIANILGNFAMAFAVHNGICELFSKNKEVEKNPRNCKILYACVITIYAVIGTLGTFALIGKDIPVNAENIYDCFDKGNVAVFIVAIIFLTHLVTVQPFFCFISKSQIGTVIFNNNEPPKLYKIIYNIIFMTTGLSIAVFNIPADYVIGIAGSVFGFMVVYYIPIQIRLRQNKILQSEKILNQQDSEKDDYVKEQLQVTQDSEAIQYVSDVEQQQQQNKNSTITKENINIILKIFFGFLIVFGLSLMVVQLLQLFGVIKG